MMIKERGGSLISHPLCAILPSHRHLSLHRISSSQCAEPAMDNQE